jgi:hypothetical protein
MREFWGGDPRLQRGWGTLLYCTAVWSFCQPTTIYTLCRRRQGTWNSEVVCIVCHLSRAGNSTNAHRQKTNMAFSVEERVYMGSQIKLSLSITTSSRVLLGKPMVKKFPVFYGTRRLVLPCSQEPATGPRLEPLACISHPHTTLKSQVRFEVITELQMSVLVFWVVTPCTLVAGYQRFGLTYCFQLQTWRCRQYVSPKRWYLPAHPQGVVTQKTNIDTLKSHFCLLNTLFLLGFPKKICTYFMTLRAD